MFTVVYSTGRNKMKIYTQNDFKVMPWKNGGGTTTELFVLRDKITDHILFRISQAKVSHDGPFSIFEGIDRILMLVAGHGFKLYFVDQEILINQIHQPIYFSGEETIQCKLIDGECLDFNIMINRLFGECKITIKTLNQGDSIICGEHTYFVFVPSEQKLYEFEINESFINDQKDQLQVYLIQLILKKH